MCCQNCGRVLNGKEKFCAGCGEKVEQKIEKDTKKITKKNEKKTKRKVRAVIVAVFLYFSIVSNSFLYSR